LREKNRGIRARGARIVDLKRDGVSARSRGRRSSSLRTYAADRCVHPGEREEGTAKNPVPLGGKKRLLNLQLGDYSSKVPGGGVKLRVGGRLHLKKKTHREGRARIGGVLDKK